MDQEISEILEKKAIQNVETAQEEFLSNIFLMGMKDGENGPVINLEKLNTFIPDEDFQMEGSCKIDPEDTYFEIPLSKQSSKYVRFKWAGNLYEFLSLCFGLGPAPKVFIPLLKIPTALLRRINI